MILSRTPFRITLGGGGTDLPSFYERHGGCVVALGIDKYMYVALNVPHADRMIRLHYTNSETVNHVNELRHDLAREALRMHGIETCIEIASLADLPAGTGLGSSSAYLVGLINAICTYQAKPTSSEALAEKACTIELDLLKKPIGKQDQYMAALGGLTELRIDRTGKVRAAPIPLPRHAVDEFVSKTHLYYTNVQRATTDILEEQSRAVATGVGTTESSLMEILAIGCKIGDALRASDFDTFGALTHEHWMLKKRLSDKVALPYVDNLYDHVRRSFGVTGGKIAGAGGGGFLMLYCPGNGAPLTAFMEQHGMPRLPYGPEFEGSKIVVNLMRSRHGINHGSDVSPAPERADFDRIFV